MSILLDKKTLVDVINQLRIQRKDVIFTHGAFDLFHVGHAEIIKRSKKLGEYLIVGVENDKRIAKYKKGRPIIPLNERINILLENRYIDFVFPLVDSISLRDKYYESLYDELNISTVTYGMNYAYDKSMEKRKRILPNIDFTQISHAYNNVQSTTKIIEKIKNS